MDRLQINASITESLGHEISLSDLESVRLLLRGDSVIDWNRANFRSYEEVDRFFKLHLFDMSDPSDKKRAIDIYQQSISYIEDHLKLRFPLELKSPVDIRDTFLIASHSRGFQRNQILACVILKLMHVIHHMQAAELRYSLAISEAELLDLAARSIENGISKMRDSGFPLVSFYGSRKSRGSVITKLIAKRENIAATIFDKLRFRLITKEKEDVLPAFIWLSRYLFSYNYVIPGQSHNNLMSFGEMISTESYAELKSQLQSNGIDDIEYKLSEENSFSGASYKNINVIVDYPIRIDHLLGLQYSSLLGRVVFVMVEFQILDERSALENEQGENAHSLYKKRQLSQVKARLRKGGRLARESKQE